MLASFSVAIWKCYPPCLTPWSLLGKEDLGLKVYVTISFSAINRSYLPLKVVMKKRRCVSHHRSRSFGRLLMKQSHKYILSANGANTIKWANQGGGCVVPYPPVVYNGRKHLAEKSRKETIEGRSYELFGVDGHCIYYGTYRCIKVATMDWDELKSLGQEVSIRSLVYTKFSRLRRRLVCGRLFRDDRSPGWSRGSSYSIANEKYVRDRHLAGWLRGITMRRLR